MQNFPLSPASKKAMEEMAAQIAKNQEPIRLAIEQMSEKLLAHNETVTRIAAQLPSFEVNAAFARQLAEVMSPLQERNQAVISELAASTAPMVEAQMRLAEQLKPAQEITQAWTSKFAEQLRPLIEQAIELEDDEDTDLDVDAELTIIEGLLADDAVDDLIDPATRQRWANMTPKQRKRAARIVGFVINAVGGVCLTMFGQPWLVALLTAVIGTLTQSVTDKIEDDPAC